MDFSPGPPVDLFCVDDGVIPHPERQKMGQGDGGAATTADMGTAVTRRDLHGARGLRATRAAPPRR